MNTLDQYIISILKNNTLKIQRQFYEKINSKPSDIDHKGYVYCASNETSKIGDNYHLVKLGRTERDPSVRVKELKAKLEFFQHTKYNKKCERCIHLLFNYLSEIQYGHDNAKHIEWFNIPKDIDVKKILYLVANYIDNHENIDNKYSLPKDLDGVELVHDSMLDDDKYDDFDVAIGIGIGILAVGGLVAGSITKIIEKKEDNINSDIKEGINGNILKIFSLDINEKPLYYYNDDGKNIYIILTDKRLVKIENNNIVSQSFIANIKIINHIKGGLFHFDKIEIIEKNNKVETFGIYKETICKDFIKLLKTLV
jgi:hypothetical protein